MSKLNLTEEMHNAIELFTDHYAALPEIDVISTIMENPNCGIFYKDSRGDMASLKCLAVAGMSDDSFWYGLGFNCQIYEFELKDLF